MTTGAIHQTTGSSMTSSSSRGADFYFRCAVVIIGVVGAAANGLILYALVNAALRLHVNVSLNRPPDRTWRRPPGRPRNKWLDQLRNDYMRPIGELWRRAVDGGYGGATTLRPSPAIRDHDDDDDDDDVCPGSLETTQEDRAHSQPERAGSCQ